MKKQKNTLFSKIMPIIFLVWFIASLVLLVILSQINSHYMIMIFGQYFLVFGIIFANAQRKDRDKSLVPYLFMLIGISCIIIPLLMMYPNLLTIEINWERTIPILVMLLFIIVSLAMIISPIIKTKRLKKVCTLRVCATVIKHKTEYSDRGRKLFAPVYEFEFNGKKYEVCKEQYTNINVIPKGTIVELLINPLDPEEFLDDSNFSFYVIGMGVLFFIVSFIIFYFMIIGKIL